MDNENIFDLEDTNDLPKEVKSQLRLLGLRQNSMYLLSLFEIKPTLTIDEILVGLKRKYNIQTTRGWISSTIYNLKRRNILKKVDGSKLAYKKIDRSNKKD